MSNLTVFNFESNEVRIIEIDGQPWFVAKDLAQVLDYADPSMMTNLVDTEDKMVVNPQKLDSAILTETLPDNCFRLSLVNESGLYAVIFGSTKSEAKVFKKWVTSEVLPTIRKTGSYVNGVDLTQIMTVLEKQQQSLIHLQKQNELILAAKTEAEIMGNAVQTEFAGLSRLINAKLGAVSDHFADRINQMFCNDEFTYFTLKQVSDFFLPLVAEDKERVLNKARCNINGIYRNLTGRYLPVNNMTYVFGKDEILFVLWKLTMAAEDLGVKMGLTFTVKKVTQELEKMLEF